MARRIVIVGGLPANADQTQLLAELTARSGVNVDWDWIKAELQQSYNPPERPFKRLLAAFRNPRPSAERPIVVKLHLLHGRAQASLYQAIGDPVAAPKSLAGMSELIDWLLSPEANLVPRTEWYGNLTEAALAALLSKLIRNKSWNKDSQGHAWTREADLLGQAPVSRPRFPDIRSEASTLLGMTTGTMFLSKGGDQGKTPKVLCVNLMHLALVKRMIIRQSFSGLADQACFARLHRRIQESSGQSYRIDGALINERVRQICQERIGQGDTLIRPARR